MNREERANKHIEKQRKFDENVLGYIKLYNIHPACPCIDKMIANFYEINKRDARLSVARLRRYTPILNFQDGKGYIIPDKDTAEGQEQIARWKRQEFSRAMKILAGLKGASMAQGNPEQLKLELYQMVDSITKE